MKDYFKKLRNKLPVAQSNKSSTWETLARGTTNLAGQLHHTLIIYTAIDYINALEGQNKSTRMELDRKRDQMQQMQVQLKELSARVSDSFPPLPNSISQYNGDRSNGVDSDASRTLPPAMNGGVTQGVTDGENGQ